MEECTRLKVKASTSTLEERGGRMSRSRYIILILVLATYALLNIFHPGRLMAYIFPSICWTALALATLWICGFQKIQSWFDKRIFFVAVLIAIFQIFILIDTGLLRGFGSSRVSFTPTGLMTNLILVLSTLLGTELSRAYLLKSFGRKRPFLTLGLVALLFTFINISIFGFQTYRDTLAFSQFLGTGFLPVVTENLLASYLGLLGGPLASIAYRGPLQAFQWFSPILPDLSWGYEVLIGVMAPTIGFVVVNQYATPRLLRKIGIKTQPKRPRKPSRSGKSSIKGWALVSTVCVLMVWGSTGLLGFYPSIISSGSMRPTMEVGDIAIVVSVDPAKIQVGDVIQFWNAEEMILHRVIDIREEGDNRFFQTKGDDNPEPDIDPVLSSQIRGRLIATLPKLGWMSIYIRVAIASIWSFFSANITLAYVALSTIPFMASICLFHAYKNRSHGYWKRKRGW